MKARPSARRPELDALRGLAAALMLNQHIGYWLLQRPSDGRGIHWGLVALNALGGLAAPLFIVLAGVGCALFASSGRERADRTLAGRGVALLALGYLLSLLVPVWFSLSTWYVLHLLGFALIVTPLARRAPTSVLLVVAALIVVAAPVAHYLLDTPARLLNVRMRDGSLPGGALRLAAFEGQFPVVPWLALHLVGMAAGRWMANGRDRRIAAAALVCGCASGLLVAARALPVAPSQGIVAMALRLRLGFFPASPIILLALTALALATVYGVSRWAERLPTAVVSSMADLGRCSLTVLLVHVVAFRQGLHEAGVIRTFGAGFTLLSIFGTIAFALVAARLWRRIEFRYGAEWLVRVAGKAAARPG